MKQFKNEKPLISRGLSGLVVGRLSPTGEGLGLAICRRSKQLLIQGDDTKVGRSFIRFQEKKPQK